MIQELLVGAGGTVETVFIGARPASCTVTITKSDGTTNVVTGQACTIDSVDTTLTAAALAGDFSLTVASAAGITTRRRYLVGDEELTIKSVSGSVVELWAPLMRDKPTGASFAGILVSAAIANNSETAAQWHDARAVFTPSTGEPHSEVVNCVINKIPKWLISEVDVRQIQPKLMGALSAELDVLTAFDTARDNMIIDLGTRDRAGSFVGVDHFRRLCGQRFFLDREMDLGPEWATDIERVRTEYKRGMAAVVGEIPQVGADGKTTAPVFEGAMPAFSLWSL